MKLINTRFVCRLIKVALLAAFIVKMTAPTVRADTIAVVNPSFETGDLTGWGSTLSGGYGSTAAVVTPSGPYPEFSVPLPAPATGNYYAFVKGYGPDGSVLTPLSSDIFQDVGALQANTDYTLTVAIGDGFYAFAPSDVTIALVNGTNDTGTVLASIDLNNRPQYAGSFQNLILNYSTGATVSGDLTVELISKGGFYTYSGAGFDNVRLDASTAAVPEPSTYALLSGSLLLLWLARRRLSAREVESPI